MRVAAVVLAGGASARFAGNKLAAPFRGRPVLDHALAAVAAVADPIVLVIGPDDPEPPVPPYPGVDVRLARDAVAHQGPLAGLATGLAALGPEADIVVVVAGDMPTLVPGVLRLLADTLAGDPSLGVAILATDPVSALPAAVRAGVAGAAAGALLAADRRSLRGLLGAVTSSVVPAVAWRALDPDGDTLRDVDSPGDLEGG